MKSGPKRCPQSIFRNCISTVHLDVCRAKDGNGPVAKQTWRGVVAVWFSIKKQSSTVCFSVDLLELGLVDEQLALFILHPDDQSHWAALGSAGRGRCHRDWACLAEGRSNNKMMFIRTVTNVLWVYGKTDYINESISKLITVKGRTLGEKEKGSHETRKTLA